MDLAITEDYYVTTEFDDGLQRVCQYTSMETFRTGLMPSLYFLVFITGMVGNILVILVLVQQKRIRNMTSIYMLNLAISDLLILCVLPFWTHYKLKDDWVFGNAMCKLLSGFYHLGLYGEIFFIILLTVDRYLAIVHAVFALRARTVTFGIISSIITWCLALLAAVPGMHFYKTQRLFSHHTCGFYLPYESMSQWKLFQALKLNILGLILPLLIMIVCYAGIVNILLRRPSEKKVKAMRLIFVITLLFFLLWTPYSLAIFLSASQDILFTSHCELSIKLDIAMKVTEMIASIHCCVNPIIYVFMGERFQKYLQQAVRPLIKRMPFFSKGRLQRTNSSSPSTGNDEISLGF